MFAVYYGCFPWLWTDHELTNPSHLVTLSGKEQGTLITSPRNATVMRMDMIIHSSHRGMS